ncbi:MAG: inositol monophosphatase family protein, partial [Microcoleus sp. SIO2G3]|nr:inositol monophosphatase family protein [Microcoleus sp. SIO2G3]
MTFRSEDQLQQIRHLVWSCGQQAQQLAAQQFQVYEKGEQDYVTSVDQTLDRLLAEGFRSLFPADGIITEENPSSWPKFTESSNTLWLID